MSADVIVASVPSLGRVGIPRLLQYNPREFKCIIIDEVGKRGPMLIMLMFEA